MFIGKYNVTSPKTFIANQNKNSKNMSRVKILILGNVGVVPISAVFVAVLIKV